MEASKRVTHMAAQKEKRLDELHDELIRQKENSQQEIRETLQNHSQEMEEMQQQIDKLNTIKAQQGKDHEPTLTAWSFFHVNGPFLDLPGHMWLLGPSIGALKKKRINNVLVGLPQGLKMS